MDPPSSKRSRIESEADRAEALGATLLAAEIPPAVAIDVLRARLDPDAPLSLAATLTSRDIPRDIVNLILAEYEKKLEPVNVVLGARASVPGISYALEIVQEYVVLPDSTVREIVDRVQGDAALQWAMERGGGDPWASVRDYSKVISVVMYPEEVVDEEGAFEFDFERDTSILFDGKVGLFTISPNAKALTYRRSGLPSPYEDSDVTLL